MMMTKRAICISLMLVLLLMTPVKAAAADPNQTDQPLHLTIEYQDQSVPLVRVQFRIFHIAELDKDGDLVLTEPFTGYPIQFSGNTDDDWRALASTLEGYILRDRIPAFDAGETDEQGRLEFPAQSEYLRQGLYLIMAERHVQDSCSYEMQPFLVLLPVYNQAQNVWDYDVTVRPKFHKDVEADAGADIKRNVLKVWATVCDCQPESVEVQLLRDGEVWDTVILSDENNWNHSWKNLDPDCEWLVVEQVPEGYTVEISRSGVTFLVVNTCQKHEAPQEPSEPTEPVTPPGKLPQTGQLWWPVPVMLCSGMLFLLLGLIRRKGATYGT